MFVFKGIRIWFLLLNIFIVINCGAENKEVESSTLSVASALPALTTKALEFDEEQARKSLVRIQQEVKQARVYIEQLKKEGKPVYLVLGVNNGEKDLGERFNESCLFLNKEQDKPEDKRSFIVDFNKLSELEILAVSLVDTFDEIFIDSSVFQFMDWSRKHLMQIRELLKPGGKFSFVPDCPIRFEILPKFSEDKLRKVTLVDLRKFAREIASEISRTNQFTLGYKWCLGGDIIYQEQSLSSLVYMCVPERIFYADEDVLVAESGYLPSYMCDFLKFNQTKKNKVYNKYLGRIDYLTTTVIGGSSRKIHVSGVMPSAVFDEFFSHFRDVLTAVFQENSDASQEIVTVEPGRKLPFKVHYHAFFPVLFTATKPK